MPLQFRHPLGENGKFSSLYTPVYDAVLTRITFDTSLALACGFTRTAGEVRLENAFLSAGYGRTSLSFRRRVTPNP